MGLRYNPMVFTEQGVAMLSSVLKSERAILVNIEIMRAFTQLRNMLTTHEDLKHKIEAMESDWGSSLRLTFDTFQQESNVDLTPNFIE